MQTENIYRTISLFIGSFILINPITIYLLTDSILLTVICPTFLLMVALFLINQHGKSRLLIYYFNFLFLLSIAYHSELIFRINFQDYNIPSLYTIDGKIYFNKPNLEQVLDDGEYITDYVTNKQGYRIGISSDPNIEIESCDWLFIGDSYTQGAQVNYNKLFTTQLYKECPDKVILNAGISGYSVVDYYNYYIQKGYKLKPSKVFVQICIFNDFMKVEQSKIGISEHLMEISSLYRYFQSNIKYKTLDELPLGRWTEPFYKKGKDNLDFNIFYKKGSHKKDLDIANFKEYIKSLNNAVISNGSELIILLIPTKEQTYYKYFEEVVSQFEIDVKNIDLNIPSSIMSDLSNEYGFDLIDYTEPFAESSKNLFYEIDEHLNEDGHEVVAKEITKLLSKEAHKYQYIYPKNNSSRYPTYLEDDLQILYQGLFRGKFQIYTLDLTEMEENALLVNEIDKIHPQISKSNRYLTYTIGDQKTGETNVVLYDLLLQNEKIITQHQNEYGAIPSFSYKEEFIVYPCWYERDGLLTNPTITLYNIGTEEKICLTSDQIESWRPLFHPNDSTVFFIAKKGEENFNIVSINIYSKEREIVLDLDYNIWDPCISRDGKYISFAGYKNENWDLFLLNNQSRIINQLTNTNGDEWDPCFNKNGDKLIFAGTFGLNNGIYSLGLSK